MTTNATPAHRLREALKAAGFNARRVTVRAAHSSLYVTIRDAAVSLSAVEAIANRFSVIHRCETTGDILEGGNTFVTIAYTDEVLAPVKAEILAVLAPAPSDVYVTLLGDFRAIKVSRECGATYPEEVRIEGAGFDFRNAMACGVDFAAKRIAIAFLDASAKSAPQG
jgi:hypothetical protein